MRKRKLFIMIIAGLVVGQIFAEEGRPFSIVNTLRFGYDDNVNRTSGGEGSAYVRDTIDLAFNAALSDRTELLFKAQVNLRSDKDNDIYPNLYAVLSHSVSPRVLLQLSDKFMSGTRTTGVSDGRRNYYYNTLGLTSTYVVNEKNRLDVFGNHAIRRHDKEIEDADSTAFRAGVAWGREISPQRTRAKLSLSNTSLEYDNRDSSYDSTDLTLELNHTFNQHWQGTVMGGMTYFRPDFPHLADNSAHIEPLFSLAATYAPSPRTRVTGKFSHQYGESDRNSQYGAGSSQVYSLGIQHDLTAKLTGETSVRFMDIQYDADDNETGGGGSDEERFDFLASLAYKLNRINSIMLRFKHSEMVYDNLGGRDWDQNMIDVGWRVEL